MRKHNDTAHYSTFTMNQQSKFDIVDEKYQRTIVYGIICMITGEIYVGSTTQTLDDRIAGHISDRGCSAIQILDRGNYKAYVIQRMPCNTYREMLTLEGGWQRAYKASFPDHFVNKKIEGQFVHDDPERKSVYNKNYKATHTEYTRVYNKDYKEKNKEAVQSKKKRPWVCEWCNKTMNFNSQYKHKERCKSNPNQKTPALAS